MKKTFIVLTTFISCISLWACNQNSNESKTTTDTATHAAMAKPMALKSMDTTSSGNVFISVDTANMMLSSYLNSVSYKTNDSDIKSVYFNADSLRAYLNDTSHGKIAYVRVMVAHNINYIMTGGKNKYAGCNKKAITAIIAGMDANYNYIFNANGMVLDHACPCPASCPVTGTGASDLLPTAAH